MLQTVDYDEPKKGMGSFEGRLEGPDHPGNVGQTR
jgi:hypothetical protein